MIRTSILALRVHGLILDHLQPLRPRVSTQVYSARKQAVSNLFVLPRFSIDKPRSKKQFFHQKKSCFMPSDNMLECIPTSKLIEQPVCNQFLALFAPMKKHIHCIYHFTVSFVGLSSSPWCTSQVTVLVSQNKTHGELNSWCLYHHLPGQTQCVTTGESRPR